MTSLVGTKVLITQGSLFQIAGSEVVTFETASYFSASGAETVVATYGFDGEWAQKFSELENVHLYRIDDEALAQNLQTRRPDVAWIHHQLIPETLLRDPSATSFIFHHMSALHPTEFPISHAIEAVLASAVVFAAPETLDTQVASGLLADVEPEKLSVLGNPAPGEFRSPQRDRPPRVSRILIVSNHLPAELVDTIALLDGRVEFRIKGNENVARSSSTLVVPEDLDWADGVITIGKTVQYSILAALPVYCYDYFGGPGWLTAENFTPARYANFSGRGFARKTAEVIAEELESGYPAAVEAMNELSRAQGDEFLIDTVMQRLLESIEPTGAAPDFADVAAHLKLQSERSISANVVAARNGDVIRLSGEIRELQNRLEFEKSRVYKYTRRAADLTSDLRSRLTR